MLHSLFYFMGWAHRARVAIAERIVLNRDLDVLKTLICRYDSYMNRPQIKVFKTYQTNPELITMYQ